MKFFAKDPVLFAEVLPQLESANSRVCVGDLRSWESTEDLCREQWVVVHESLEPKDLISYVFSKNIPHFVQKNNEYFCEDLKRAGGFIESPLEYFQSDHLVIDPRNSVKKLIRFSDPKDKSSLIQEFFAFLDPIPNHGTHEAATAAVEELYMNAVIDAPKECEKRGMAARSGSCELFLACNENTLQISCSDPFGSLDLKKLFGRMNEVYQKGAGEAINLKGTGGAGIGCYLLFEQCRSLIFGVRPGLQTKVTCLIPLTSSRRERLKIKKSLHGFEVKS